MIHGYNKFYSTRDHDVIDSCIEVSVLGYFNIYNLVQNITDLADQLKTDKDFINVISTAL